MWDATCSLLVASWPRRTTPGLHACSLATATKFMCTHEMYVGGKEKKTPAMRGTDSRSFDGRGTELLETTPPRRCSFVRMLFVKSSPTRQETGTLFLFSVRVLSVKSAGCGLHAPAPQCAGCAIRGIATRTRKVSRASCRSLLVPPHCSLIFFFCAFLFSGCCSLRADAGRTLQCRTRRRGSRHGQPRPHNQREARDAVRRRL